MYTMYTRYIQQYRFSAGEKGSHFLTGRLASNCAYTRLRWLLRELLSFSVLCNIPVRDMAYPWWEYLYYSVGYCYSCVALRQRDVHVPARHKITNPLIPQQAAVIPMPTGSHSSKVLSFATLSRRRQPQTLVEYSDRHLPKNIGNQDPQRVCGDRVAQRMWTTGTQERTLLTCHHPFT